MIDSPILKHGVSRIAMITALAGLALSACQPSNQPAAVSSAPAPLAALALSTSGAPPIAPAPTADALPSAPPARVAQLADASEQYAFADRADAMSQALGDAPPDYTFDYDGGQRPWVWRSDNQSMRVAEALPGGGYRYYYYEPGSQTPYLVRDPVYSYGYDNGVLVVVYDSHGQALSWDDTQRQADAAGRFLARAEALFLAAQQDRREAVAEANWAAQRSQIAAEQAQWAADQAADAAWNAYHLAHEQQEEAQWDAEQYRREAQAARFAQAINDAQLAAQDWQAAQNAHNRAAATGQLSPTSSHPGLFGLGGPPHPQPPAPPQPQAPVQSAAPAVLSGPLHVHVFPPGPPQPQVASGQPPLHLLAGPTAAQIAANVAAQNAAAHKAQLQAQQQAQLAAQSAALAQANAAKLAAARQAAILAAERAKLSPTSPLVLSSAPHHTVTTVTTITTPTTTKLVVKKPPPPSVGAASGAHPLSSQPPGG